jgi:hypothetical protein
MRECLAPADIPAAGGGPSDLTGQKPARTEIRTLFLRLT